MQVNTVKNQSFGALVRGDQRILKQAIEAGIKPEIVTKKLEEITKVFPENDTFVYLMPPMKKAVPNIRQVGGFVVSKTDGTKKTVTIDPLSYPNANFLDEYLYKMQEVKNKFFK